LLTKADKLNKTEAAKALSIAKLQAGGGEVRMFSALNRLGVDEMALQLRAWAAESLVRSVDAAVGADADALDADAAAETGDDVYTGVDDGLDGSKDAT
jgi:GTP-binding protein